MNARVAEIKVKSASFIGIEIWTRGCYLSNARTNFGFQNDKFWTERPGGRICGRVN